ncbi:hypothetical protein [Nodosilinea sp. FACHB-13]|uniref:hypothetical protein n=1 Tax=Cyanophyceae TaxID=3028117 RepID=UPI0016842157|nr:hypothetical protein [Nodosilinea sp. FACHB-13]MBD2106718.1 hypothetical protein [Nodosilinea sp. FACHB-13]
MKAKIPPLKSVPGIPRDLGTELRAMPTDQLEAIAGACTPEQVEAISRMTDAHLQAIVAGVGVQ